MKTPKITIDIEVVKELEKEGNEGFKKFKRSLEKHFGEELDIKVVKVNRED